MTEAVKELETFPQSSPGAPIPLVLASEDVLQLLYYVHQYDPEFDGTNPKEVGLRSKGKLCAWVKFTRHTAFLFGPPSDEIIQGHRLHPLGLKPYGVFEVENSKWIEDLKRQNSVHPYHRDSMFEACRHLIFTFHDSTFEVVAEEIEAQIHQMSLQKLAVEASKELS